jgi:hypothetical protein
VARRVRPGDSLDITAVEYNRLLAAAEASHRNRLPGAGGPRTHLRNASTVRWDEELKTFEHWEFFYRAKLAELNVAVAVDCFIKHAHVESSDYRILRKRSNYRSMGLRKHGFHSMRYPSGGVIRA